MFLVLGAVSAAQAGPFTQIQVLLPGETAAPGTPWGKTGTPQTQVVGVPFTFRVRACDDDWNLVSSITDIMRFSADDASADLPADRRLSGGELSVQAVINADGQFTITVRDMSDPTIPFGASTQLRAVILVGFEFPLFATEEVAAGEVFTTTIRAIDPQGNRVNDFSAPVELQQWTSFGLGRIDPPQVDFVDGLWTGEVQVFRADETQPFTGAANIYAYLAADEDKNGASDPFTVAPAAMRRIQVVLPGQTAVPGSFDGVTGAPHSQIAGQDFTVQLYATDLYWNLVTSFDEIRVTSSDAWSSAPMTVDLYAGQAQFGMHFSTSGSQTLTVSDLTDPFMHGMTTVPVTVIDSGIHHFVVAPVPSPAVAGQPVNVTITAVDADGNLVPNWDGQATLAANTGAGSITPETIHFNDGVWQGHLTFYGAGGAVQFTCADYATPPHEGVSNAIQVTAGAYTALQVILPGQTAQGGTAAGVYGDPLDQDAGEAFTIQVRAVDSYWNRVPGIDRPVTLTSTDVNLGVPEDVELVNGEALVPVTVYRAGEQTITASDPWTGGIDVGHSSPVAVAAGPYRKLLVLAPGESPLPGSEDGRTGAASDQSINFAFDVTVLAADQWWNPVNGVDDVVHLTTTDPLAELAPDAMLADGALDMAVRLSTGGYQQISVVSMSQPAITGTTTQVRAINSGIHYEAELDRGSVLAGAPFELRVRVTNDAGSILQEINSAVQVEVLDAATLEPGAGQLATATFQLLQGQRTVIQTYTDAASIVLRVSGEEGSEPALTGVLEVAPAVPAVLTVTHTPEWVRANETVAVTATLTDEFGNANAGVPVLFQLDAGEGELVALDAATDADGVARAEYHSPPRPETCSITVAASGLSESFDVDTALVDPGTAAGTVTNYPNPFHPDEAPTTIAYVLDADASVRLRIYSLSGGLVRDETFAAGAEGGQSGLNEVPWDGRNGDGEAVSSGGYILQIEAQTAGAAPNVMRRRVGVVW